MSFFSVHVLMCVLKMCDSLCEMGKLFRAGHQVFWPQMKVEEEKLHLMSYFTISYGDRLANTACT